MGDVIMNKAKNISKYLLILVILIFLLLIYTFLGYMNIISLTPQLNKTITIIIGSLFFLITSYFLTKNKLSKGIIRGTFIGLILITFFLVINIILKNKLNLLSFIKYSIYLVVSIIGGIIGVNKAK